MCVCPACLQYILWYGILGTILGRKLLWLTKLLRPLGQLNTLLTGIPGSSTVLAAGQPFAHSEEFVMVSVTTECHDARDLRFARACCKLLVPMCMLPMCMCMCPCACTV